MEWEKTAALDWNLPAYGRIDSKRPLSTISDEAATTPDLISTTPPPSPPLPNENATHDNAPFPLPSRLPFPTRQSVISGKQRMIEQRAAPETDDPQDNPAKRRWRQGQAADAVVRLPEEAVNTRFIHRNDATSNALVKSLADGKERGRVLERIAQATDTHIVPGFSGGRVLLIWGTAAQVAQAKAIISKMIEQIFCRVDGRRRWSKIHPEYVEDLEKILLERAIKTHLASLREQPATDSPESPTVFNWPNDGPTIQEGLGNYLEKLDSIREEFQVHIYMEEASADKICISATVDTDMEQILARLQDLWKSTVAKLDTRIKAYILEPPSIDTMREKVVLVKSGRLALPLLQISQQHLLHESPQPQCVDIDVIRKKNNELLLSSFRNAFSKADLFAGHLRMRVHFGSFVMDRYREPGGGQKAFGLDEFRDMILLDRARGRLVPGLKISGEELISRCMSATSLFQPVNTSYTLSEIKDIMPTYAARFEFSGVTNSLFCLEVDFRRRSTEIEKGCHRWFNVHDEDNGQMRRLPLQVGVMNFLRSDWQGDIEIFEPLHNDQTNEKLVNFLHSIRFNNRPKMHGMATKPQKKVMCAPVAPLSGYTEKSAIQLLVKGTKYVFEMARFDRYTQSLGAWSSTPTVSWGASLFDPSWDAALGADIKSYATDPKYTANQLGPFECFFPPQNAPVTEGDNKGFLQYIEIVYKISDLLGLSEDEFEKLTEDSIKLRLAELIDVDLGMLF
ncbi:hypothetical protein N7520_000562 [Penicillium odoratum]|uniref:uncharacterized protein n=1 Tax=Penicillium odoratum TaxID=1167516 RepID=UPI002547A2FC|nr:uncharacterized protein N7520_000562 [Penicillium odoratum]KAJ5777316.1 hypothetical protein N7520_000562 [Penicillium odoratum]